MASLFAISPALRLSRSLLLALAFLLPPGNQSAEAESQNPADRSELDRALAASSYLEPAPALSNPRDLLSWRAPEDLLLLIFSAGSDEERLPDPCGADRRITPAFLTDLAGSNIDLNSASSPGTKTLAVLVFCSPFVLGAFDQESGDGEPKIARRSHLLATLLTQVAQRGLSADQVFLVGHSAGAWASMEAAGLEPDKLAGVVALAPAFAGPRDERPATWQTLFEDRRQELSKTLTSPTLLYTFQLDRYGEQSDIADLAALPSVTPLDLPSHRIDGRACRGYHPHRTAFYDCFRRTQLTRIKDFLVQAGQKR
ncbi:alpha/beta hydrolase [Rhodovibrionaceae bacterium A322]